MSTHHDWTVVHLHGPLDLATSAQLRGELIELIGSGRNHLILDLDHVDVRDSTGLGVLVTALHRIRAHHGVLRLVATDERVLNPLRTTGLLGAFSLHPDLTRAAAGAERDLLG